MERLNIGGSRQRGRGRDTGGRGRGRGDEQHYRQQGYYQVRGRDGFSDGRSGGSGQGSRGSGGRGGNFNPYWKPRSFSRDDPAGSSEYSRNIAGAEYHMDPGCSSRQQGRPAVSFIRSDVVEKPSPHLHQSGVPSSGSVTWISHTGIVKSDVESVKAVSPVALISNTESAKCLVPMKRPDLGGTNSIARCKLLVNHFLVKFDAMTVIKHYDIDIKSKTMLKNGKPGKISKSDFCAIRNKLFSGSDKPITAYDGKKSIYSVEELEAGTFQVDLLEPDGTSNRSFSVAIKLVNELKLNKVENYFAGNLSLIPRDVLQAMDLIMKENPSRKMISIGRGFYRAVYDDTTRIGRGIFACGGFQSSLKANSQGKKVTVMHRRTKQKYLIKGLTDKDARHLSFQIDDPEGKTLPRNVGLVEYFRDKYKQTIRYVDVPCLDLGSKGKRNYVPLELCQIVPGQRYPTDALDHGIAKLLKEKSSVPPNERKSKIQTMITAVDGPCGGHIIKRFGMEVDMNMARVEARLIEPPDLKLGASKGKISRITVDKEKRHWNLVRNSVVTGKVVDRWAVVHFITAEREREYPFWELMNRCARLRIDMKEPLLVETAMERILLDTNSLRQLLESIAERAKKSSQNHLQFVLCVVGSDDIGVGYSNLKWVSETQVGIVTQCSQSLSNLNDQYFANLALKINAKLGGSNVELSDRFACFHGNDGVMFIGADVNHPGASNMTSPSIAAVVATMNWPVANRYAARIWPQENRIEKILHIGQMCSELVDAYYTLNKMKPQKIIIFRDGVSEGQFDMVLNEELQDIRREVSKGRYRPTITLIVAQKRHQTRFFPENRRGNIPPGTVVDTIVVHPFEFDFFLCSHYGGIGTSKPTHYHVLWDEHSFTSDQLQRLIYDLCFTFARCTKPVSLVPPVFYADILAYRGRMYQQALCNLPGPHYDSSFDRNFYMVHKNIENEMFFV